MSSFSLPHRPIVYLACHREDRDGIKPLYKFLREQQLDVVLPRFNGAPEDIRRTEQNILMHCDAVIIFHGAGDTNWRYSKAIDVTKMAGYYREKPLLSRSIFLADDADPDAEVTALSANALYIQGQKGLSEESMESFLQSLHSA